MLRNDRQNTISAAEKCGAPSFTNTPITAKPRLATSIQRDCIG